MNRPWWRENNYENFESHGLRCAMRRGPLGAWCGYVEVLEGHPLFQVNYSQELPAPADLAEKTVSSTAGILPILIQALKVDQSTARLDVIIDVHGGLTFSGDDWPEKGGWWFGFDCSHAGDLTPDLREDYAEETYRDSAYVKAECKKLAKQLAEWPR